MLQGTYLNISGRWVCPSVWLLWNSFCFMACTVSSSYIFGARLFESRLTLPQGLEKVNRSFKISLPLICVFNCSWMLCIAWDCSNSKLKNKWYIQKTYWKRIEKYFDWNDDLRTSYFTVFVANGKIQQLSFFSVRRSFQKKKYIYIYCNDSNTF